MTVDVLPYYIRDFWLSSQDFLRSGFYWERKNDRKS